MKRGCAAAFAAAASDGRAALIPYVVAGYPDADGSLAAALAEGRPLGVRALMHIPNAMIMETVRSYCRGWYPEVVTEDVHIADGMLSLPDAPGLGTKLREEVLRRPDVHVESSDERHRYDPSNG